ncbi:M28 family metallopeptidase [Paenibacillus pinisoli]|uniref:M28 family metallopeptidase n=1 Tax=Paenibacillus pinisoli TaxID=1276110 RepID=UPI001403EE28|nr:M28 family metallopeptidase [Paenibacillus pinisoli]
MNLKRIAAMIATIGLTLMLASCTEDVPKNPLEQSVKALTASEMKGRLTGTEGNAKAQAWIEEQFKTLGLTPLAGNSFAVPYNHKFYDPDKQQIAMEAIYSNERRSTFKHGASFIVQAYAESFDVSAPITSNASDPELADKMLITDRAVILSGLGAKPKAILVKTEAFKKNAIRPSGMDVPIVQISPLSYRKLIKEQEKIERLRLNIQLEPEPIQADNVVGILPGQSNRDSPIRSAIVISAHFDGVGWTNNTPFDGALDNASGVSALLELAANLKNKDRGEGDLVFAAFNGEESGLQGSRAFVQQLKDYYDIVYNINLDSIAGASRKSAVISSANNSVELAMALGESLNQNGITVEYSEDAGSSDHLSFSEDVYQSVTISDDQLDNIHTSQDTAEHIDYEYLEQLVQALSDFLTAPKHHPEFFRSYKIIRQEQDVFSAEQLRIMKEEAERHLAKLKLGQYTYFVHPITFTTQPIYKFEGTIQNAKEFEEQLQGAKLPNDIAGYPFQLANVNYGQLFDRLVESPELDVIYTVEDLSLKDITSISLQYTDEEHGIYVGLYPIGEDEILDMNYSSASVKVKEYKDNEGGSYYLEYYPEYERSLTYIKLVNIDGQDYYVRVYEVIKQEGELFYSTNSSFEEKEKLIERAQSIPLETIIRQLGI